MNITPELLDAMLENGLSREQIVALMKVSVTKAQADAEAARAADLARAVAKEAERLAKQSERQQRRRRLKSHIEAHPMCDNVIVGGEDVTKRDTPAPSLNGRPSSPAPLHPTLKPSPTPGSDADASAEAAASPPAELSVSDQIWIRFPDILAGMSGKSDKSVRTWMGKLLSKYRAEDVLPALQAAADARTGDPFGYATRVLNPVQTKQAQAARGRSAQDLWATDAIDANQSRQRGSHDTLPFDRSAAAGSAPGDPEWHPVDPGAHRGADRLPPQQPRADARQLPPLRIVGCA